MLNTLVYDFLEQGRINLDFQLIVWTFGKFPIVISIWMCMAFSTTLFIYPLFQHWAYSRRSGRAYWYDYVWLAMYVIYQVLFVVLPIRTIKHHQLPTASTVVVVTEQIRLMMKAHAFIRENIPRALAYVKSQSVGSDAEQLPCPDFSKYLYFLFAPTLVYRDVYPRNTGPVRWNYVVSNFVQVLASLFYIYYIFERFCIPVFRNFSSEFITPHRIIVSIFGCMLPGTLVLFITFFAILHSWLNAFAEMLRFADRLLYKDWWNSSTFSNYYRTWNVVVHDWLYSYIYKECYILLGKRNRAAPMASVFLLSAVFHEYILTMTFGFFYPVLFIMFAGAGFAFIFLPNKSARSGNVFMWVALFIGNGVLMCLYSMEWYARRTCPNGNSDSIFGQLVPRSWFCDYSSSPVLDTASTVNLTSHTEL
jgi:sterol O-acyltransferase